MCADTGTARYRCRERYPIATVVTSTVRANKIEMQNRLFAELSSMFGKEVPLYGMSLEVNKACNRALCALLSKRHPGFAMSDQEIERTSGERHGAIRIGRADEFRWIGRLFACFAMEPHNFYDMTDVGPKSQPIIATAFRSSVRPEHRVFSSLLMTDYFDPATRARIEALLAKRAVFSDRAKELVERSERQGGLDWIDANALIAECTGRIFRWTGRGRDHALFTELAAAGFKIAADISCFESHHLNHLTPNTLCMDLYTAAMKRCLAPADPASCSAASFGVDWFEARANAVLARVVGHADRDFLKLHFRHLSFEEIDAFRTGSVSPDDIARAASRLSAELEAMLANPESARAKAGNAGFKDFTEGPSEDTPVFLRQDAYKALTEPVEFQENDGSTVHATHTARFGEIEERFYACTPAGCALYNQCLAVADAVRDRDPSWPRRDIAGYEAAYAAPFAAFPKTLSALIERGLVHARYAPTARGIAAGKSGSITTTDLSQLVREGFAAVEGLRYEDFLPVSAAGIFASNLNQYGTRSTAAVKPTYTRRQLEEILGRRIIDSASMYAAIEAESTLETYIGLGIIEQVPHAQRAAIEAVVRAR